MTTQDFEAGLDMTNETEWHGSQLNQIVDVARTATDKGLIIETADVAGVPAVPNPNAAQSGVTPTWWKRYVWKRQLADGVYTYVWDDTETSDATYLKWVRVDALAVSAASDATVAKTAASAAEINANSALTEARTATELANDAQDEVDALEAIVTSLTSRITALEGDTNSYSVGDIRVTSGTFTYSDTTNEGWILCDGRELSTSIFANLFARIGYTYGAAGTGTNFKVPDLKGRVPLGSGTGTSLTARTVGDKLGSERVTLTAGESGVPSHLHDVTVGRTDGTASDSQVGTFKIEDEEIWWKSAVSNTEVGKTRNSVAADAANSHENMPPFLVLNFYIKT